MAKQLFSRNSMALFVGTVKSVVDGADGRACNLEIEDIFDKTVSKVTFWNGESVQRADRIRKLKVKADSVVSFLAIAKDDGTYTGLDIKYINGVWNFKETPEEKERNIIYCRLFPGKGNDSLFRASFPEYDFEKREDVWSDVLFFNYADNDMGKRAAQVLSLAEGEKYKKALIIANPASYQAFKKLEDGGYDNRTCDESFTKDEAQKQGYTVKKQYSAIKFIVF